MAITILERREEHLPKLFKVQCNNCKSVLTYETTDLKSVGPNEDGIECPVCKQYVDHNPKNVTNPKVKG